MLVEQLQIPVISNDDNHKEVLFEMWKKNPQHIYGYSLKRLFDEVGDDKKQAELEFATKRRNEEAEKKRLEYINKAGHKYYSRRKRSLTNDEHFMSIESSGDEIEEEAGEEHEEKEETEKEQTRQIETEKEEIEKELIEKCEEIEEEVYDLFSSKKENKEVYDIVSNNIAARLSRRQRNVENARHSWQEYERNEKIRRELEKSTIPERVDLYYCNKKIGHLDREFNKLTCGRNIAGYTLLWNEEIPDEIHMTITLK
jgi:hypothetical protein